MERKCHECGAPVLAKKCDYCGAKLKKKDTFVPAVVTTRETTDYQEQSSPSPVQKTKFQKVVRVFNIVFGVVFGVGLIMALLDDFVPSFGEEMVFVCTNSPMTFSDIPEVSTVTMIEAQGQTIIRWINQNTFERQVYTDYFWGAGWDLADEDVVDWFEGPNNVMWMVGTYWELVSINEYYVVTNFIYEYQNMSREDLDSLWYPSFRSVRRGDAIRSLQSYGAECVRQ